MILPPDAKPRDGDHEPDFEDLAKQSWQSFSTMKRFVSEANRLENASWRLWFMQRNRSLADAAAGPTSAADDGSHHRSNHERSVEKDPTADEDAQDRLEMEEEAEPVACVYCELHRASLSCHGCCHDAYCVGCFKLVHKKGHLATHTAVKIETLSPRERERLAVASAVAATDNDDESSHPQYAHGRTSHGSMSSDEDASVTRPSHDDNHDHHHSNVTSPVLSPDHSRHSQSHHHHQHAKDKRGKGTSWEIQMDLLLQRLMVNSLHCDQDISVHNIDSRRSLGDGAESIVSCLSDLEDPMETKQTKQTKQKKKNTTSTDGMVPVTDAWSDRATASRSSSFSLSSSVESLASGNGNASAKILSVEKNGLLASVEETAAKQPQHKQLSVDVAMPRAEDADAFTSPTTTTTTTTPSSLGVSSPVQDPLMPDNLESLEDISSSFFPSTVAKTKSRKKNSVCANCNGNHITIDCPLLENSLSSGGGTAGGVAHAGVDTVLRKCFTTIHNDNLSNSTHAFLGDEVSVRGGGHFTKGQFGGLSKATGAWSSFGMNSISEDQTADVEDTLPVLAGLLADSHNNPGDAPRQWDATTWMVSSLATELPLDVFEALRRVDKGSLDTDGPGASVSGWIHMKKTGSKWCKRFVCLYRNNLWEYLDEKESSRPIGYANLADGSVHTHQNTRVEFAFRYVRCSTPDSPRDECWIQCETTEDAVRWRDALALAAKLQADDLFDMRPDAGSPTSSDASYELGKGRFATVRRARRRRANAQAKDGDCCALKIIDKQVFWDLVAHERERDDTVIREILTQTVLTVRAGNASYCPVIRLLSLFETRSQLVMELELMREGDLHEEIVTKSAVNEATASYLVASLVEAIHFCQQNGVAHRDVKLSNLALDVSQRPKAGLPPLSVIKLADFGMAAFIQPDGLLKGRCGTPGFVAPEILTAGKGEAYPSGVDMFSVGVVTYTMLCGYEPFFGVNDEELIQMNKAVEFEFEEPEWSSISDEAKDLITLMMERDTTRRITPLEALEHPFLMDATRELRETTMMVDAPVAPILRLL